MCGGRRGRIPADRRQVELLFKAADLNYNGPQRFAWSSAARLSTHPPPLSQQSSKPGKLNYEARRMLRGACNADCMKTAAWRELREVLPMCALWHAWIRCSVTAVQPTLRAGGRAGGMAGDAQCEELFIHGSHI